MDYMEETNTPFQPQQPQSEPQFQKPNNKKRLFIVIAIGVALGIVGIIAIFLLIIVHGTESDRQNKQAKPMFTDWLKPTEELKIGDFRYVSACQLLPEDAAGKIFGKFSGTSNIWEDYADQNLPNDRNELKSDPSTECLYRDGRRIRISVEQIAARDDLSDLGYDSKLPFDTEETDEAIQRYEKIKELATNSDAKAFLEHLKVSASKQSAYQKKRFDGEFDVKAKTTLDGVTLPSRLGIEDFAFTGTYKNLVVTISHSLSDDRRDKNSFSDKELVDELAMMRKAFAEVRKNAANPTLSQSPAPTVRGNTDKLGTTRLAEACKVLDSAAFETVTGIKSNDLITRYGLPLDPSIEQKAANDSLLMPSSECARGYSANNLPEDHQLSPQEQRYGPKGYVKLRFDINHANSAKQAEDEWARYLKGFSERMIDSSADAAFLWGAGGVTQGAIFKVGPYICGVSFTAAESQEAFGGINDLQMDDATHIAAVNQLAKNLREFQQKQ